MPLDLLPLDGRHAGARVQRDDPGALRPGLRARPYSTSHFSSHASRRLIDERIPIKPGVVELLDFLGRARPAARRRHLGGPRRPPSAISAAPACSTGSRPLATRDDVEHAKPAPDLYLEAARRLGVAPERCVAFEDSSIGLTAAHAAGTHGGHGARHPAADRCRECHAAKCCAHGSVAATCTRTAADRLLAALSGGTLRSA